MQVSCGVYFIQLHILNGFVCPHICYHFITLFLWSVLDISQVCLHVAWMKVSLKRSALKERYYDEN